MLVSSYSHLWDRSPRDSRGNLVLQANNWDLYMLSRRWSQNRTTPSLPWAYPGTIVTESNPSIQRAIAVAESDLRGDLVRRIKNKEMGSLGVSIATAGQSIQMLRKSGDTLAHIFLSAERIYRSVRGRRRLMRIRRLIQRGHQPTAGLVLEGFFGWAPLLEDVRAVAATVSNPWPNKGWVSVKKRWACNGILIAEGTLLSVDRWSATGHSTYATSVRVSNPNLWLGNKLGLLNLPGIAWDLVPWSFLVNMVSNMGQVMGSLSDLAGVSLSDSSLTRGLQLTSSFDSNGSNQHGHTNATATTAVKRRTRRVGAPVPPVVPYLRFPEWNIGLAAIAGALMVQNCQSLSSFLGLGSFMPRRL